MLDALGVLVWDEARDFYATRADEFRSIVKQHRSHPCIVVYGLCNEMECYASQNNDVHSNSTILAFKGVISDLDPTRPAAFNDKGETNDLEVAGFSHSSVNSFTALHKANPTVPQVLSECCSCNSDRGALPSVQCMQGQNSPGLLPFVAGSIGVWTL